MAMTITEKILARAAGKDSVSAGDLINANIDVVMCHDVTTPPAISMLKKNGIDKVFDPDKIVVTPDHFQPAKDIKSAELLKRLDDWVKEKGIKRLTLHAASITIVHPYTKEEMTFEARIPGYFYSLVSSHE